MRWQRIGLGCALIAGCTLYAQEVARVEQGLVGLPSRALRRCMPVPAGTHTEEGIELVSYRWTPREESVPQVTLGSQQDIPTVLDRSREERDFLLDGKPPKEQAYCELTFELQGGRVRAVRSVGRDSQGLNANAACLMEARPCLPSKDR